MNALATAIQQHGLTGTAAEIVAALGETVIVREDHTLITYAALAKLFSYKTVSTIDETLKQVPGMDWVRMRLSGIGLDFADAETQAGLADLQVGGALTPEMAGALLALGITNGPLWQKAGLEKQPDEAAVEFAQQQIAVSQWAAGIINDVITPMVAAGNSIDEIKTAIAGA